MMFSVCLPGRRIPKTTRLAEPIYLPAQAACPEPDVKQALGGLFIETRERCGLTRERAAVASNLLTSYVEMMESGDYTGIPDPLYLLPFFRRYAGFLKLNVAEVTASFIRDFEAQENTAVKISEPSGTNFGRSLPWRRIAQAGVLIAAAVSLAAGAVRLERRSAPSRVISLPTTFAVSPVALAQEPRLASASPVLANSLPSSITLASTTTIPKPKARGGYRRRHISTTQYRRRHRRHLRARLLD
jgi:hypothetical protein